MYTLIGIFVCILFSEQERNKHLILLYIFYSLTLVLLNYYQPLSLSGYLYTYTFLTSGFALLLLAIEQKVWRYLLTLGVILPHFYYLYLLHYPYVIPEWLPFWFLQSADTNFGWGVFILLYSKGFVFDMDKLSTREYGVNVGIVLCVLLFSIF